MPELLYYISFSILVILFIFFLFIMIGWRWVVKTFINKAAKIIFTDSYQENLLELMPGLRHMGVQNVLENMLRAESGDLLHRPLGSSKNGRILTKLPSSLYKPDHFLWKETPK